MFILGLARLLAFDMRVCGCFGRVLWYVVCGMHNRCRRRVKAGVEVAAESWTCLWGESRVAPGHPLEVFQSSAHDLESTLTSIILNNTNS